MFLAKMIYSMIMVLTILNGNVNEVIEETTNRIVEVESTLQEMRILVDKLFMKIESLEKENQNVIATMSNNQSTIANWISIVGTIVGAITILIAFFTIILGLMGYKSIKEYFKSMLDKKIEESIVEKSDRVKDDVTKYLMENISDKVSDNLRSWDKKFTALHKEVKGGE